VFVGHGLLVFDTLGDFAYDDRSPTLAGSDFPRSRKVIATECSVDAPERFARGIYGQRNPTILLKHAPTTSPPATIVLPLEPTLKAANSPDRAL
jgi:hypothetical protein